MLHPGDSQRLEILRFPLILFVLYLHNTATTVAYGAETVQLPESSGRALFTELFSGNIARAAVPLFFLFAGYLFFTGFDGSAAVWRHKLRRRVGTLLLPYLFWNIVIVALFLAGRALPLTAPFFNLQGQFSGVGPWRVIDATLGITRHPVVYPMWFIRDLMVLVVLSLPLHWMLTRTHWLLPSLLLVLWLVRPLHLPLPSNEAGTFFVLGAFLALRQKSLFMWERLVWLFAPLCLALLVANLLGLTHLLRLPLTASAILSGLCMPRLILMWPWLARVLTALAPASFFVFAAHEPFMTLIRKLLYRVLEPDASTALAVYLLLPLAIATITTIAYFLLLRASPRLAALASGSRVAPRTGQLPKY